ncbi:MAG TPA: ABC transporter ATP-binding protein [Streptosporangiaceae bacterium]|nr:ABC transporter ATP-binding protein [Streptosporangiaceae bacterium]
MGQDSLEVSGLVVRFESLVALDGVSLIAQPAMVTGIIGPNGAGKTTLLNAICGFVTPQAGQITFDGKDLLKVRAHQLAGHGIARTLQSVGLFSGLSVIENVMVGANVRSRTGFWLALAGWSDRDEQRLRDHALTALDRVGVADLADRMPATLPHGSRKRVALARALVAEPRMLLLDEPASGLPEDELPELGELITEIARDTGVLVIEHRMDLMMSVCQHIFVLDFGVLIAQGSPAEVQANPLVTEAYLGVLHE